VVLLIVCCSPLIAHVLVSLHLGPESLEVGHLHHDELYGARTSNYDSFHCKQTLFKVKIPMKFVNKIKIRHLFPCITFKTIWIEHNAKAFNLYMLMCITLFIPIVLFCGTDNTMQNNPHI
jgi:hypothetical protein